MSSVVADANPLSAGGAHYFRGNLKSEPLLECKHRGIHMAFESIAGSDYYSVAARKIVEVYPSTL